MRTALAGFEAALRDSGAPTLDLMRPGLSAARIRELREPAGLVLTDELVALWSWRDGTERDDGGPGSVPGVRLPRFRFVSLDQALAFTREAREISDRVRSIPGLDNDWHEDWLLIGKDRFEVAATLGPGAESEAWTWQFDDRNLRLDGSLADAVDLWTRALREGWWRWDPTVEHWRYDWQRMPQELGLCRLV